MKHKKKPKTIKEPIGVLISDVHYNIKTLHVADKAVRLAIEKANELFVPLIVPGDLHDTKANLRGECISAILTTFSLADFTPVVLVGNHDLINEKSKAHSLSFLNRTAIIVDHLEYFLEDGMAYFIPYQSSTEDFKKALAKIPKGTIVICHQGVKSSNSGDYIQDKSAVNKEDLAGHRIISGHYHNRQSFDLPDGGKFDYVGNPYSLTFGEANDPDKGFQILYDDGSLEFVPTNLRKHIVLDLTYNDIITECTLPDITGEDLVWVKIKGQKQDLDKLTKVQIAQTLSLNQFRLELIPDTIELKDDFIQTNNPGELLDQVISDLTGISDSKKKQLKNLWKIYAD